MDATLVNVLLNPIIGYFLPIQDTTLRLSLTLALTNLIYGLIKQIEFGWFYQLFSYFIFEKSIEIKSTSPTYEIFVDYLKNKYKDRIKVGIIGCGSTKDKSKLMIKNFNMNYLNDEFISKVDNKKYSLKIKVSENIEDKEVKNIIAVSGKCEISILNQYIEKIIEESNVVNYNNIPIYSITITESEKTRKLEWMKEVTYISKTMKNTIVSEKVYKLFYADLIKFIQSEAKHHQKGLPYRRGYLLHGLPGTGKTSLIKAVANDHNLPIFIVGLNEFESNNELEKIVREIKMFVHTMQKYILLFEDVDRTKIFQGNSKISLDCLLNILDGVDEATGRITIFTCNYFNQIKSENNKALFRPGRIDRIVEVTNCDHDQLTRILNFHFPDFPFSIEKDVKITPASLIQIIQYIEPIENIENLLNNVKNFDNFGLENVTEKDLKKKEPVPEVVNVEPVVVPEPVKVPPKDEIDENEYPEAVRKSGRYAMKRFDRSKKYIEKRISELVSRYNTLSYYIRFSKGVVNLKYVECGIKHCETIMKIAHAFLSRRMPMANKIGDYKFANEDKVVEIVEKTSHILVMLKDLNKKVTIEKSHDNVNIIEEIKKMLGPSEKNDEEETKSDELVLETESDLVPTVDSALSVGLTETNQVNADSIGKVESIEVNKEVNEEVPVYEVPVESVSLMEIDLTHEVTTKIVTDFTTESNEVSQDDYVNFDSVDEPA